MLIRGTATDAEVQLQPPKVSRVRNQDALQKMQEDIEAHTRAIEQLQTLPASIEELKTILLTGNLSQSQEEQEQLSANGDDLANTSDDPTNLALDILEDEGMKFTYVKCFSLN